MGRKSPVVVSVEPPISSNGDVAAARIPVTNAERIVIRMLARRAARKVLARTPVNKLREPTRK
jgi:hypothetical protein